LRVLGLSYGFFSFFSASEAFLCEAYRYKDEAVKHYTESLARLYVAFLSSAAARIA
jgi:hypothetical protein